MNDTIEIILRALIAYFILLFLTRIMGKREISQLSFFDYVVGITIGSITANMVLNLNNSFYSMLPALLIFALLQIISSVVSYKSKSLRIILQGTNTILIDNGKIMVNNLAKERINLDELLAMLRQQQIFSLDSVAYAFLETSGRISVLKRDSSTNITKGRTYQIIENGKNNTQILNELSLSETDILNKLESLGIKNINSITLAEIDSNGNITIY